MRNRRAALARQAQPPAPLNWILCAALASVSSAPAADPYTVGRNIQVSIAQPTLQHYETQIAADPQRAGHLIACAYVWKDEQTRNEFYVSFNGGASWKHTLTVTESTDPSCTIGLKGEAFAGSIHDVTLPDGTTPSFLNVQRSADGGRTWSPASVRANSRSVDRDYITVDDSLGPFRGRVYVHGYLQRPRDAGGKPLPAAFVFYPSDDGGKSFERAVTRQATDFGTPWFFPANGVVTADGTFLALFAELDNTRRNMTRGMSDAASAPDKNGTMFAIRSRDGGQTLEPASKIAEAYYDWRVPQLSMASLALDRSNGPYRGRIYAAWPDARLERRTQILLSHSTDTGKTWSSPQVAGDGPVAASANSRPNNFMPMVAVNRRGVLGISWYDRRDNPDNLGYWPRFAASLDGGITWLPSTRVSTHGNLVNPAEHDTRYNGGDTTGLAADAKGRFHVLWIDNRTGVHQMWTATVAVRAAAKRARR